jgi:hypothetical protein
VSMEYETPEKVNLPEMLPLDDCICHTDRSENTKRFIRAKHLESQKVGLSPKGNWILAYKLNSDQQRPSVIENPAEDVQCSPKAIPREDTGNSLQELREQNSGQASPKPSPHPPPWNVQVCFDPTSGYLGDFTPGILTVTFTPLSTENIAKPQECTAQYQVNLRPQNKSTVRRSPKPDPRPCNPNSYPEERDG